MLLWSRYIELHKYTQVLFLTGNHGNHQSWFPPMPFHHLSLILMGWNKKQFWIYELKIGESVNCDFKTFWIVNCDGTQLFPWFPDKKRTCIYLCNTVYVSTLKATECLQNNSSSQPHSCENMFFRSRKVEGWMSIFNMYYCIGIHVLLLRRPLNQV